MRTDNNVYQCLASPLFIAKDATPTRGIALEFHYLGTEGPFLFSLASYDNAKLGLNRSRSPIRWLRRIRMYCSLRVRVGHH